MAKKKTDMDNFGGFGEATDISFFGEDNPTPPADPITPPAETDDTSDDDGEAADDVTTLDDTSEDAPKPETDEEDETDGEDSFFGSSEIEEDEAEDEETPEGTTDTKNEVKQGANVSFLNQLKERGLADFELEEGEELTDERAAELIEDSYEQGLEKRMGDMLAELPPVTRDLVKFAVNGGNESEFLAKLKNQPSVTAITKDMDLSDEKNQELVIRKQLESEDHDQEYIDSNIEFLKESGKLATLSEKYHQKIIARDEKQRAADLKAIEDRKKASKESLRKFKKDLASHLETTQEYKGFKFGKNDAKELPSYISEPKIQTDNGAVSEFQRDLFNVLQNKEKSVLLAKLIKSDFDFSPVEKSTKTKQTKKVQEDVRRTNSKSSGSSRSRDSKTFLAEFFGD